MIQILEPALYIIEQEYYLPSLRCNSIRQS